MDPIVTGNGVVLMGEAAKSWVMLQWVDTFVGYGVLALIVYVCYRNWPKLKLWWES